MSLRAFLKGESSFLDRSVNTESFSAPKRTYFKPSYSSTKVPKKLLDENEYPTNGLNEYKKKQESVANISYAEESKMQNNRSCAALTPRTFDLNGKSLSSIKTKEQFEKVFQDLGVKWSLNNSASGTQLKSLMNDTENLSVSLIGEIDRLNELLNEKISEIEKLRALNVSLETRLIELSHKEANEGILRQELLRKTSNEIVNFDTQANPKLTLNSEEASEVSFEGLNGGGQRSIHHNTRRNTQARLQEEEERLRLEELVEQMNNDLGQREEENDFLRQELEIMKKNCQNLSQQALQHQQVSEKLRNELKNSHQQNQELNQKLANIRVENESPHPKKNVSYLSMESPKNTISVNSEATEYKKKYESAKSDNERLMKMVAENQKTIQNFKEIFVELKTSHNINFEKMKQEYEEKIKDLSEMRSDSRISSRNDRMDTQNSFLITSQSLAPSEILRTSRDNLDYSRGFAQNYK